MASGYQLACKNGLAGILGAVNMHHTFKSSSGLFFVHKPGWGYFQILNLVAINFMGKQRESLTL